MACGRITLDIQLLQINKWKCYNPLGNNGRGSRNIRVCERQTLPFETSNPSALHFQSQVTPEEHGTADYCTQRMSIVMRMSTF